MSEVVVAEQVPLTIRRAGESDYALIRSHFAMSQDAHAAHMPERFRPMAEKDFPFTHFKHYFTDDTLLLVAELDGDAAGSLVASLRQSDGYYGDMPCRTMFIWNVATDPALRRRGIARSLIGAAAEWAAEKNADRIDLTVWSFNVAALELYRRIGFDDAYTSLTVKPSDALARLGSGRLPKSSPPSWLWWLPWRR